MKKVFLTLFSVAVMATASYADYLCGSSSTFDSNGRVTSTTKKYCGDNGKVRMIVTTFN